MTSPAGRTVTPNPLRGGIRRVSSKLRAHADAIILACARVLMELRSGIYKGIHGVLNPSHRRQFEEGVNLLFSSWTALCLAIDNEWGGPASRQKAEQLYQDVLCWFYGHTGSFVQPPDGRGVVSLTYCTTTHLCVS